MSTDDDGGSRVGGEREGLLGDSSRLTRYPSSGVSASESESDAGGIDEVFLVSAAGGSASANAESAALCRALRWARNFFCWLAVLLVATLAAAKLYEINASGMVWGGGGSGLGGRGKTGGRAGGATDGHYPVALNRHDVLRQYRLFRLPNGLDVACISDPQAHDAAAAMNVRAGSFQDPPDRLGLAHFTEHMLFLGTETFPDEAEYSHFLSTHGGSDNAYTSDEDTNYFLRVAPEALRGALDRFSKFFSEPLLRADSADREVNAVDSEFDGHLSSDAWHRQYLLKFLAAPTHPFHQFSTGNRATLAGGGNRSSEDSVNRVRDFWRRYYTPSRRKLAVVAPLPLDVLENLSRSFFGDGFPSVGGDSGSATDDDFQCPSLGMVFPCGECCAMPHASTRSGRGDASVNRHHRAVSPFPVAMDRAASFWVHPMEGGVGTDDQGDNGDDRADAAAAVVPAVGSADTGPVPPAVFQVGGNLPADGEKTGAARVGGSTAATDGLVAVDPAGSDDDDAAAACEFVGRVVRFRPFSGKHRLQLLWQVPYDQDSHLALTRRPVQFILHLLGHETEGSILHRLKHFGWATSLMSSTALTPYHGFSVVSVTISLTDAGFQKWSDVVRVVYHYIYSVLRKVHPGHGGGSVEEAAAAKRVYVASRWDEQQLLRNISWHYPRSGNEQSLAKAVASRMELLAVTADRASACRRERAGGAKDKKQKRRKKKTKNQPGMKSIKYGGGGGGKQHGAHPRQGTVGGVSGNSDGTPVDPGGEESPGTRGGMHSKARPQSHHGKGPKRPAGRLAGLGQRGGGIGRGPAAAETLLDSGFDVKGSGSMPEGRGRALKQTAGSDNHGQRRRRFAYEMLLQPPGRDEFDPEWVHMLASWLNPSNMNVLLESPALPQLPAAGTAPAKAEAGDESGTQDALHPCRIVGGVGVDGAPAAPLEANAECLAHEPCVVCAPIPADDVVGPALRVPHGIVRVAGRTGASVGVSVRPTFAATS